MNNKNVLFGLIFLFSFLFFASVYAENIQTIHHPSLIKVAYTLPHQGVLKQKDNGYVYLEVSPNFINQLFPMIQLNQVKKNFNKIGAHITVFTDKEVRQHKIFCITELGKTFQFKVTHFEKLKVKQCVENNDGDKFWYVLKVESPELIKLRTKYGIASRHFHMHISIGYKQIVYPGLACPIKNGQLVS